MTMQDQPTSRFLRFLRAFITLDRRWIFLAVGVVALAFLAVDMAMPIPISDQARDMYNTVEALKPGARVHLSVDYTPGSEGELWPQHFAVLRQLMEKRCKVICSSLWDTGPLMIERAFDQLLPQLKEQGIEPVRGVDFVNLGYKAGDRVAIANIGASFKATFPTDYGGNKTAELPIMQGWDNYSGIDLLITICIGDPGATEWIQQAQSRYKIPMVAGATAVLAPQLYSFYQSGNLKGFLAGLAGAAEYETLVKHPDKATRGMNVQSALHMLIVALVILANLAHLILRLCGEKVR